VYPFYRRKYMKKQPLILLILDGWGLRKETADNAIAQAHTPHWDALWEQAPHALIDASGPAVGLPDTQMGNSEVGHMHIGSGRITPQELTRINTAIAEHTFAKNPVLQETIAYCKTQQKPLHLLGLLSPGGVHSHENHLFAILAACHTAAFDNIVLHVFLDGRDTPPISASDSLKFLADALTPLPNARVNSLTGRYYAMDRDKRWERLEPVYQLLCEGHTAHTFETASEALAYWYARGITDEFIPPTGIGTPHPIKNGDAVLFFNYRADRARQLTEVLLQPEFSAFERPNKSDIAHFVSMAPYDDALHTRCLFPPFIPKQTLGEVLATHHLRQLRIAETEKYAHVSFFFNGGIEKPFPLETRELIPSPKVATYDLAPEMSALHIAERIAFHLENNTTDVIICNLANADMVGHTGNLQATRLAIETIDKAIGIIQNAVQKKNGHLIITADHGNAEMLFNTETQQAHTAHTSNPVPFVYVGHGWKIARTHGSLIDIAPTILNILRIDKPPEMMGESLLTPILPVQIP